MKHSPHEHRIRFKRHETTLENNTLTKTERIKQKGTAKEIPPWNG